VSASLGRPIGWGQFSETALWGCGVTRTVLCDATSERSSLSGARMRGIPPGSELLPCPAILKFGTGVKGVSGFATYPYCSAIFALPQISFEEVFEVPLLLRVVVSEFAGVANPVES